MDILIGASGSGKDTVKKILVEKYGYKDVVKYTTRPIRKGEKDGVDYHFVDWIEFSTRNNEGFFGEVEKYNNWYYGSAVEDYDRDAVIILPPGAARSIVRGFPDKLIRTFYLSVPRRERLIRCLTRGDDIDEAIRRNLSDVGQFDGVEKEVDFVINGLQTPEEIASIIVPDRLCKGANA